MEEKKLKDEEIVKAWEICIAGDSEGCIQCPYAQKKIDCVVDGRHYKDTLDLFHRLQDKIAEYERMLDDGELVSKEWHDEQVLHLEEQCQSFLYDFEKQNAEIERLKNETTYLQRVADAFKGDYKNAKADGVRELLQELIEMEIQLDPLRSGIRYKALIGYAEENEIEVDL